MWKAGSRRWNRCTERWNIILRARPRGSAFFSGASKVRIMPMPAVVMNMFYTGLGIARSLGLRGVRVIGLSATRIYGNHTRYAEIRRCPDSRDNPVELLQFLLDMAREIGGPCVIFPTRDDDARFLDRYRAELEGRFISVIPSPGALRNCLDKFESYRCAMEAG